jgi:hypothetical protein
MITRAPKIVEVSGWESDGTTTATEQEVDVEGNLQLDPPNGTIMEFGNPGGAPGVEFWKWDKSQYDGIGAKLARLASLGIGLDPTVTMEVKFNDNGGVDRVNYYDSDNALIGYFSSDGISWQAGSLMVSTTLYSDYLQPAFTTSDLNLHMRNNAYKINFNNADSKKTSLWIPPLVQTINATPVDYATIPVAEGKAFNVEARLVATPPDLSQMAIFHIIKGFKRATAGNVTAQANSYIFKETGGWAVDASLEADTGNQTVDLRVTGIAGNVDWKAELKFFDQN